MKAGVTQRDSLQYIKEGGIVQALAVEKMEVKIRDGGLVIGLGVAGMDRAERIIGKYEVKGEGWWNGVQQQAGERQDGVLAR